MKCVIINTADIGSGGAEMAGYAIFDSLNKHSDFDTYILCGTKNSHDPKTAEIMNGNPSFARKLIHRAEEKIVFNTIGLNYRHPSSDYLLDHPFLKNADVINLHNIHVNYFAYPMIRKLNEIAPVVVTMQDMWYLTGHCAYTYDCEGFKTGCKKCPHLDWFPQIKHDTAGFHAKKKKEIFEDLDIHMVSCSNWLIREAEKSYVLRNRKMHHIYNPIETDVLYPIKDVEKSAIRKLFRIPEDKNVVCFGAANIGDERKGFKQLLQSLDEKYVRENNLFFVIMGNDSQNFISTIPSFLPHRFLGNTKTEIRNYIYNLSDLLVLPSLADDLPNMILESLASGLPVVTFDVGGSKEVIKPDYNGYLANYNDFSDFKKGISSLLQNKERSLSDNCRNFALDNFSPQACAEKYSALFKKIIAKPVSS